MGSLSVSIPDTMKAWVDRRIHDGRYGTASAYICDLIRRDRDRCDALVEALVLGEESGASQRTVRQIIADSRPGDVPDER